jgi:hypothetical protein
MNKRCFKWLGIVLGVVTTIAPLHKARAEGKVLYENNFEKADLDKVPDDFLVLDGAFAVKQEGGNRFLELPGSPLDSYGVLFGPSKASGTSVAARIFGTRKGRRFPTFGVGVNGVEGFKLQVSPAKDAVEIYKGDQIVATQELKWESGAWYILKLQTKAEGAGVRVQAKIWRDKEPEPKDWQLTATDPAAPPAGKASVWGKPFAGTPIRYDDIKVAEAE